MSPLHRLARRASRRLAIARFVRTFGVALPIALTVSALAVLTDRLVGPGITWWWIAVGGFALALIVSAAVAWHARAGRVAAASEVDTALKLKDRLASAIALEGKTKDDPFASIALDEATTLAKRVRVEQAIPVRPERSWWWWPVAAAAVVGVGIFVPQMRLLENRAERLALIEKTAAEQKADAAIDNATKELEEALKAGTPESGDFELAKELSKLAELREQMQAGVKDPQEAAAQAATQLDKLAEQLDNHAAESKAAEQAAQSMFDQAASEVGREPQSKEVDRMIEAMRKGDMEAAMKAAEDLEKALENMSEEEAARAVERLEQFADAVERAAQQAEQAAANQAKKNAQNMANRGLSQEAAQRLAENAQAGASQSDLEKQLREQGLSEQAARELSEQLAKQARDQRSSQSACKNAGECSKSLREGAKSLSQCKNGSSGKGAKPGQQANGGKPNQSGKKPGMGGGSGEGDSDSSNGSGKGAPAGGKETWELKPGSSQTGAGNGTALHNLKQKLSSATMRMNQAQRSAKQAQQLRVSKEDLLRQLADKSLIEKQQWLAQQLAESHQDRNWKYNNEDMDVREGVDDGQVIAQQHTPGDAPLPYIPGAVSDRVLASELTAAMEASEKAIEDRVIPSRYRNIQRYFQKAMQRSQPAPATEPAAPAAPAPDATPVPK